MILQSLMIVLCIAADGPRPAVEATPAPADSTDTQRLAFSLQSAREYEFKLDGNPEALVRLLPKPLLRWDNRVVREDDAMLFLWVVGDHPVAAAQFFLQGAAWHHEFQSLNGDPFTVRTTGENNWSWSPTTEGLRFVETPDAPARAAPARLRQMKGIAERFHAATYPEFDDVSTGRHDLRLLPTPVYRYAAAEGGVIDAGLFAYCQGTNPELLILIEARAREGDDDRWWYAFAPMTSFALRAWEGDRLAWEQSRQEVPTRDFRKPYCFRYRACEDRSAEMESAFVPRSASAAERAEP